MGKLKGGKVHTSTVYRWAKAGKMGVRLEVIAVGGTTCTSVEALQRFFDRLTEHQMTPGRVMTAGQLRRQEAVERELDRLMGPVDGVRRTKRGGRIERQE